MLALLIAAGVIPLDDGDGSATGPVVVPPERVAEVVRVQGNAVISDVIPRGAREWEQAYDPADHAKYAFDWSPLLPEGEKVGEILSIRMSSAAAALGIAIDTSPEHPPIIEQDARLKVQLWFVVAEEQQESAAFLGAGVKLPVTMKIATMSTPPEKFERTNVLTVRQQ